jgi:2-hydroxychromene-2-carboxylate isomerase/ketosteroid isomerase-like protein
MTIEFWFDFASPYSWLAAMRVEPVARRAGRTAAYRPFLLGPVFQALHGKADSPFNANPPRLAYLWRDVARQAARQGLPFRVPTVFPRTSLLATRVTLLAEAEPWVGAFVRGIFAASFHDDRPIGEEAVVRDVLEAVAPGALDLLARANEPATKDALRARTAEAQARGIFGAPTWFVGGELHWGNDRLEEALGGARFASRVEARAWAEAWAADWSRLDVPAVLARFAPDAVFESPLAERLLGAGRVVGRDALAAYWGQAARAAGAFTFRVEDVVWDPEANELVVVYLRHGGGAVKRKTEHFRFRGELVAEASAYDGAKRG